MLQRAQQDSDPKHTLTLKQKKQDEPIDGLSPDDDIGVTSDNTGKPGAPMK